MAPKRKRPERQFSNEDTSNRPSPHRPENLGLAQQSQQNGGSRGGRGGGGRRPSRQSAPNNTGADSPQMKMDSTSTGSPAPPPRRETPTVDNSRAGTPSQPIVTSQPPPDEGPKSPPAPYFYEHVTDDRIESWQDTGKIATLQEMEQEDNMALCTMLQELTRAALDGRLDATEAGSVVKHSILYHSKTSTLR